MDSKKNPCALDGFAFLEFSAPEPSLLHQQCLQMGFQLVATHTHLPIFTYQQGQIQFIINETQSTQAQKHAELHGPGACAMGFKVDDAQKAFDYVVSKGAKPIKEDADSSHQLFGIEAIGGSAIYFVDKFHHPFQSKLKEVPILAHEIKDFGLLAIDHLTHNVFRGNMDKWYAFYTRLFNFKEIRYFDIHGKMTGLVSRALESPCGKIKIPLNESKDDKSQIEEFLQAYRGEGIQHIALTTRNIYESIPKLKLQGVHFLDVPDTYYEMIDKRIPWHDEPIEKLKESKILIDGEAKPEGGLLLQIFTKNVFGPVFFEIIQREGNQGFGEGNFQALFEAIERDQVRRGTL